MRALILRQDGLAGISGFVGNQLDRPQEFLEFASTPRPKPGLGQVLIKVRRAAINPSDIAFIQGFYGQKRIKGEPAGFEGVGTVIDAGPGLMGRLLKGRDVVFYVTPNGSGAWADYAVTHASMALPLKKGVSDQDAAAMLVNPVTAIAMLDMVRFGDAFVFSAAASQLGKLIARLAAEQGKRMIALVRRDAPIEPLKALGATYVLNETAPDFADQLASVLAQEKPVIFLDSLAAGTSTKVFDAMGANARWVIYGKLDPAPTEIVNPGQLIFQNKSIEGFWTTKWAREASFFQKMRKFNQLQNRFRDGQWTTDISAELPIEHALERLPQALAQPDGKVQIVMGKS